MHDELAQNLVGSRSNEEPETTESSSLLPLTDAIPFVLVDCSYVGTVAMLYSK